jgi:tRNA pseudouridine38-40 synthase
VIALPTFRLSLEYDGTRFAGWQVQPKQRTVQGELERALGILLRHDVRVLVAGRTDAGVHALAQVCSLRTEVEISERRLIRGLNGILPKDIAVWAAEPVAGNFHPRFQAHGKHYRYRILARPARSAVDRARCWHVFEPLDAERLQRALEPLLGTHNFHSFRAADCPNKDPVKTIRRAAVTTDRSPYVEIDLVASGFLKQMVRIVVGTAVEVATGRREPEDVASILAARDRSQAGRTAPAQGLFLVRVIYGEGD